MSETKWTPAQRAAIDDRGGALLVSAAAGSGKTAVLTERAVRLITDPEHPVDADRLLIVTFTNAAAAELRARIGQALLRRSQAEPGNTALRRQRMLFRCIFWISALSTGYWTTRTLDTPSGLFFSNIFLMMGCAMCGLSQSLIASFRLWQIRNRRVSQAEKGTFRHFLAESNWFSEATGIGKGKR